MKDIKRKIIGISLVFLIIIFCLKPGDTLSGAGSGINICLKSVLPSLFPFMFLINMLINGNYLSFSGNKYKSIFVVYLLSAFGGYPIGAKIIDEMYKGRIIDKKSAQNLVCFTTHSGPGFIILCAGVSVFGSGKIGFYLMAAHILSSAVLSLFFISKISFVNIIDNNQNCSFTENLITSCEKTSSSVIAICSFVILFSVFNRFILNYLEKFIFFKYLGLFLEVTNGINNSKNIYIVAFLLGFGGFCVWAQVLSCSKSFGLNLRLFAVSRLFHGLFSAGIMYIFVIVFNLKVYTSNIKPDYSFLNSYNRLFLCFSMIIMVVVLLCSLRRENKGGNLLKDIV